MKENIPPTGNSPASPSSRRPWIVAVILLVLVVAGMAAYIIVTSTDNRPAEPTAAVKAEKYTCGMHPWIISDKPGDCPICGMKLTKVDENTPPPPAMGNLEDLFSDTPSPPGPAEGLAIVRAGEESLRLAGLQTAAAVHDTVNRSIRTVGIVVPDETRIRHVHTKIAGWVEKLHVNFTGQMVEAGTPILTLYSPELLASQEEFLKARETAARFTDARSPEVKKLGDELLRSARRRLELFDVPETFIAQIEASGQAQRSVTLNAPVSGFVTAKGIFEGQNVEPGLELFNITDLSRVWIEADLYEYEASVVKPGQEATLTMAYDPGVQFNGKVAYIFPYLSTESRTLKVRFEFPNTDFALKPQMYADVTLELASAEGVAIPDSALIDTGIRKIVFVETAPGTFEPRDVKIGVRGGGKAQILAGVVAGEHVVVKANFLLDSESRLRAAINKMTGQAPGGAGKPAGGQHQGHGQ